MSEASNPPPQRLPYEGLRVVEFTHMVMGPTCGMVLADLGAEVIKVEPIGHGREGDATRQLIGSGAGFFPMFNRNKKSLALDLQTPEGLEAVLRLIATADIVSENFKPGTMTKLGLDYASLKALNPRLIYVSHKGFLPGPYEHRTELDATILKAERVNASIKSAEQTLALAIKRGVSDKTRERMEERIDDLNDEFIFLINATNRLSK